MRDFFKKNEIFRLSETLLQSRILLYFLIFLLILRVLTLGIFINFPQNIFFADITKTVLINLVNQERKNLGLNALLESEKLNQAAYLKAENMIQNQYFDHTSPSGISPWHWFLQAGYDYKYAGENLAIGFFNSEEVYNAWLNSPSHRSILLNPNYKETGIAVLSGFGKNNAIVVVQLFGTQKQILKSNNKVVKPASVPKELEKEPEKKESSINATKNPSLPIKSKIVLGQSDPNASNNFYLRFLSYMLYNYEALLRNIIYGFSVFIIGLIITLILSASVNFKRSFVLRILILVALLSLNIMIDRETLILTISRHIII